MNDDLDRLEAELKNLTPTPLTPTTHHRIAEAIRGATDEIDHNLEQELSALVPAPPSASLEQNLSTKMSTTRRKRKAPAWPILLIAAAAIVAAILIIPDPKPDSPPIVETIPPSESATIPKLVDVIPEQTTPNEPTSSPMAFSDPRAQAMVAAGYRPVSLQQMVLDTHDIGPDPDHRDARQVRIKVLQAIEWNHDRTGVRVDTKQVHEAIIRRDATFH